MDAMQKGRSKRQIVHRIKRRSMFESWVSSACQSLFRATSDKGTNHVSTEWSASDLQRQINVSLVFSVRSVSNDSCVSATATIRLTSVCRMSEFRADSSSEASRQAARAVFAT